jgi:Cellulase (glycosyl hydrolase family 5)
MLAVVAVVGVAMALGCDGLAAQVDPLDSDGGVGGGAAGGGTADTGGGTAGTGGGTAGTGGGTAGTGGGTTGSGGGTVGTGGGTHGTGGGTVGTGGGTHGTGGGTHGTGGGTAGTGGGTTGTGGGTAGTGGGTAGTGGGTAGTGGGSGGGPANTFAQGWLYTQGNKIYVSDGQGGGSVWVGRGANLADVFLGGYNNTLWMGASTEETTLSGIIDNTVTGWNATFLRISLSMKSYTTVSWLSNQAQYQTPMYNVISAVGTNHPGVYVEVTLRSDTTMTFPLGDEATCIPTASTDPLYRALVDDFGSMKYVIFGVANEPGGNTATNAALSAAMSHAVATIRAEEDAKGFPHHLVAVQGNSWTSNIGFYNTAPLAYDNVIYEVHGYPPATASYTQSNIPVFIGEYGPTGSTLSTFDTLAADLEAKQIPSLAWMIDPYSGSVPDMVSVTHSTTLTPNAWGNQVKTYLLAH